MSFGRILLLLQVFAHISWIPLIIYGESYHYLIILFIYFLTGCLGMSMTYHRLLAHKSYQTPFWFEILGTFLGTIGLTGSSLGWTAIHREHHQHVDTKKDPHSPKHLGFFKVQFFSMFKKPNLFYVRDLQKRKLHRFMHRNYLSIHFLWGGMLYLIDPLALCYAYLCPATILWNSGSSVNSFCHLFGYKNFKTKDNSKNNFIFGFLTFGEGWHNNHHASPLKWSFKHRWFEFDMGGTLIRWIKLSS